MEFDSSNPYFQKLKELSSTSDVDHFYRNIIYFGAYLFRKQAKVKIKKIKVVALKTGELKKIEPKFQEKELMSVQQTKERRRNFTIFLNLTRWGNLGRNWVKKGLVKSEEELRLRLAIVIVYNLFHNFALVFDEIADFLLTKTFGFEPKDISRISQMVG